MIEIKSREINGKNCFILKENEKDICACFYDLEKNEITDLEEYEIHDIILNKAVVKAVLNSLDLNGVETVICKNKKLGNLLTELGFSYDNENGTYILNLKGYFDEHKCCN